MKRPIVVRPLSPEEQASVEAGLRSADAFVLRRCQILAASARGEPVLGIARLLSCNPQTVRNAIHAFNQHGVAALRKGSSVAHRRPHTALPGLAAEALRDLLHRSPRDFGKPTSLWTLSLAAEVSFAQGLTAHQVSGETIRATLARLGVRWRRAKQWITSPDPAYLRKKERATA
jgi:Winged helix-turn helix